MIVRHHPLRGVTVRVTNGACALFGTPTATFPPTRTRPPTPRMPKSTSQGRGPGFSLADMRALITWVANITPNNPVLWTKVQAAYNSKYAVPNGRPARDTKSLRTKFFRMASVRYVRRLGERRAGSWRLRCRLPGDEPPQHATDTHSHTRHA